MFGLKSAKTCLSFSHLIRSLSCAGSLVTCSHAHPIFNKASASFLVRPTATATLAEVAAPARQEPFCQAEPFIVAKVFISIVAALLLLLPSSMRIYLRTTHGGKVMQTTLRMFTRFALVCLLVVGLQMMASAQGRGRGAGGSAGGPPAGTGVDRGIGKSSDASAGRADTGRATASDKSKGRSDAGLERARAASEKAKADAKDRRREHKRCVKDCNQAHKNAIRACRGRTGADRAACERAANEAHRNCVQGCPR